MSSMSIARTKAKPRRPAVPSLAPTLMPTLVPMLALAVTPVVAALMMLTFCALLFPATVARGAGSATVPAATTVTVSNAWVRGTVPGQTASGAYMQITAATDATLTRVTTPIAKVAQVHNMQIDAGVMKMTAVPRLPLPAGQQVELRPGGYHVMLMGLSGPLVAGTQVPLTLTVTDRAGHEQQVEVSAVVRPLTARP